jgi:hypothetical protein
MPTVTPPNEIGRCPIRSPNLEHFPVPIRLARVVPMDHDPITHAGLHGSLLHVHWFYLHGRSSFATSLGPKDPRIIASTQQTPGIRDPRHYRELVVAMKLVRMNTAMASWGSFVRRNHAVLRSGLTSPFVNGLVMMAGQRSQGSEIRSLERRLQRSGSSLRARHQANWSVHGYLSQEGVTYRIWYVVKKLGTTCEDDRARAKADRGAPLGGPRPRCGTFGRSHWSP